MHGNEQVGTVSVGDCCPFLQFHKLVGGAGVINLHAGEVLFYLFAQLHGHTQRDRLFLHVFAVRAGVFAAVPGINHNGAHAVLGAFSERGKGTQRNSNTQPTDRENIFHNASFN